MQHIVLTIEDRIIEQAMSDIAQHEGLNPQDLIMQAIRAFIRQKSQHVKPYASVTNSAHFGKTLRETIWGRTANG
ncbi:hypothetical protein U27_05545 [Candidatus Vecturithrix granuli]|uniref:Uncharacterized protein n=1 Tax=Vecturithrix granuli TaxID=1499967 RepID=A0A081C1W6_VECG1|nr:hypothetical protein U27_05545 [Candidatus Vecturithrix granuli]